MKISRWLLASCLMSSSWGYANLAEQPSIQKKIDHLSTRLVAYTAKDSMSRYQAYKAKMWLSYAQNELSETSLTTAGQEALQNAQILVDGLVQGQPLSLTTPILSVSQVMRRDLWQQVEYLKQQGALATAPENLAHAEVMLVWAAAEYCELGWRHANEHFDVLSIGQNSTLTPWQPSPFNCVKDGRRDKSTNLFSILIPEISTA